MAVEPVSEEHKERWPREYAAFKLGMELPSTGTPSRCSDTRIGLGRTGFHRAPAPTSTLAITTIVAIRWLTQFGRPSG